MKVLLAIDDSQFSAAATQAVLAFASPQKDTVRVLHVLDTLADLFPEMAQYCVEIEGAKDPRLKQAENLVRSAADLLGAKGLDVTMAIECGEPRSKIIDVANAWGADLIVLGSHGRTGLGRFLIGSVSDAVMRHACCSVEIVRIPARH
jgi:nucleotide-binding universal stress UspA family protein